jgi:outer membrane protein TolC
MVNNNWQEAGLQLSYNVFNLATGPTQTKLAEAGVALADQRRVAGHLATITQMHLARLNLANARGQLERADAIYTTDNKIAEVSRNREAAQAQSKLDVVSNETAAILSLLRRYQALAQVQTAESRLLATLGLEPEIGSTGTLSLKELTEQVRRSPAAWEQMMNKAHVPTIQPRASAPPSAAAPSGERTPAFALHNQQTRGQW